MNAVEIDREVSELFQQPFDAAEFPFQFLASFDRNETTLKRLRTGNTNRSDVTSGVLQRNHIHIAPAPAGEVDQTIAALRESPRTASEKARYILATDGAMLHAEDLTSGDVLSCTWDDFSNRFGFFLPLAGITTVQAVKESAFDIKATGRLNRLYVELLKDNADWRERRSDMNHFMARLIFCFFAEDTDIFHPSYKFTETVQTMSAPDSSNTHEVIETLFRAMNTPTRDGARTAAGTPGWADGFPYVNGQLFSGDTAVPCFSRMARSYLLSIGSLNWREINPDIFGSMIQAVADDEERGSLGMHYTSVPNILKVLNPLFLDDLRAKLDEAEDNVRKLVNLRNRMARIRVFDPACGSGNFLVIAYKEMRKIEAEINMRRGEKDRKTDIPLTNYRGIELRDFPAEVARLALIIAEYQCDVLYRGQQEALAEFLPLDSENWITCGNALRLDWLSICPPTGTGSKIRGDDLFETPLDQSEIDFENAGGETYIGGNPPYLGTKYQSDEQKADLKFIFSTTKSSFGNLDYVGGWFELASRYINTSEASAFALVTTTSLFQGEQAEIVFSILQNNEVGIEWCYEPFKWSNQATNNAGVACCIAGVSSTSTGHKKIYSLNAVRSVDNIGPYLIAMPDIVASKRSNPLSDVRDMGYGSMSNDDNEFSYSFHEFRASIERNINNKDIFKYAIGGNEFVKGLIRPAIYLETETVLTVEQEAEFSPAFERVRAYRAASQREATRKLAATPQLFAERRHKDEVKVFVPQILSERRPYVTAGFFEGSALVIAPHMQISGGSLFDFALVSSHLHLAWITTVCGKLETRLRYSNTLGWNTFPVPALTEQNKADLTKCAGDILLARESYFPATIADMYDPERIDTEFPRVRAAHDANDEVLERIYIGRRFRNDTERLEHLFARYAEMTQASAVKPKTEKKATAPA